MYFTFTEKANVITLMVNDLLFKKEHLSLLKSAYFHYRTLSSRGSEFCYQLLALQGFLLSIYYHLTDAHLGQYIRISLTLSVGSNRYL